MGPAGTPTAASKRGAGRFPSRSAPARRALAHIPPAAARGRPCAPPPTPPPAPRAPAGLRFGARRPPPPSPPPGPAAASSRALLPGPAARWAAGTPPPPVRAPAEVSGGAGRGLGGGGEVCQAGRSCGRGPESQRRPGEGGRATPSPRPHFRDGGWVGGPDCPLLEGPAAGHFPRAGAVTPGPGEPAGRSCGGCAGRTHGGASLRRGARCPHGGGWGEDSR